MKFNWKISKQVGRPCIECIDEANAQQATNDFGGTIKEIDGVWYNVWPLETPSADRYEQPYFKEILIRN